MPLPKERITYLLEAYTTKRATAQEEQELMEWIQDAKEDDALKTYIEKLWNNYQPGNAENNVDWDEMFKRVVQHDKVYSIAPGGKSKKMRWPWMAAAAAIIIFLATGTYLLTASKDTTEPVAGNEVQQAGVVNDVAAPNINRATLRLGNGRIIILDSAGVGSLSAQGIANARKLNEGELAYSAVSETVVEYHTLNVPKGSKPMHLQLADGSEVWLNAASSITFPNVFAGNERKVSVTGEVYLEVAPDKQKPFILSKGEMQVEVMGTKFNVNAYDDDEAIKVTLIEGSIKVRTKNNETMVKPGQQAKLKDGALSLQRDVNIDEVMAWKNGFFEFNNTDVQTIMRQVERWYDVEVVYNEPVSQHFNGTIERQVNVSKVLNMLEKTGGIRFTIEGKKVIVKNYK